VPTATGKKMSGSALRQALAARQSVAYSIIRRSLTGGPVRSGVPAGIVVTSAAQRGPAYSTPACRLLPWHSGSGP
jgi:hypothetical protein